ncbi:MAG: sensor histidine kinase, partial [Eggerthellaceae bacterium]|nr:sensor histidine kinase [Eggerthellaceae bacterium]
GAPAKEVLREVVREINVYDAAVKTGNASLDVVLTEKGLLCKRDGITLSSVADGTALSFMTAADIYTLVGNALDNAIDAVRSIDDEGRRSISLNLRSQLGMASLSVENYYAGEIRLVDGVPKNEGYGMEKILAVVERYGGTIVYTAEDGVFHLDALFPQG